MRNMALNLLRRIIARRSRMPARSYRLRSRTPVGSSAALKVLQLSVLAAAAIATGPAYAVPSFAIQTGQPCAACHIGAFGPQLTPYGRDFKLHGYTASDGRDHGLPLAVTTQTSFTHTMQPQPGGAA